MRAWTPRPAGEWPEGLILYDGVCVFCSRWVKAVIARDTARRFSFVTVQSPYGRAMAETLGIDPENPQTNAVIAGGQAWLKSDAAIAVLERLPGWSWTGRLRFVPRPLRNAVYDLVARNRYRLFGKSEVCFRPTIDDHARLLDDRPPPPTR